MKKIKELRTAKGLTLKELSDLSGVSKSRLSELENGQGFPNAKALEQIAKALNATMEELLE